MFFNLKSGANVNSSCFVTAERPAGDAVITRRPAVIVVDTCSHKFKKNVGSGACGELVAGDEVAVHSMAPNFIFHGARLDVISGVAGAVVTVNLYQRVSCPEDDCGEPEVALIAPLVAGHDLTPVEVEAVADECTSKVPLEALTSNGCGAGSSAVYFESPPLFLGDAAANPDLLDYFITVSFDALPENWDCDQCCIKLRLTVDQDPGSDKMT